MARRCAYRVPTRCTTRTSRERSRPSEPTSEAYRTCRRAVGTACTATTIRITRCGPRCSPRSTSWTEPITTSGASIPRPSISRRASSSKRSSSSAPPTPHPSHCGSKTSTGERSFLLVRDHVVPTPSRSKLPPKWLLIPAWVGLFAIALAVRLPFVLRVGPNEGGGDEWYAAWRSWCVVFERGNPGSFLHPALFYEAGAALFSGLYLVGRCSGALHSSVDALGA